MKLLIKIPTRSRGAGWFKKYIELSTYHDTHFLISLDQDDTDTIASFNLFLHLKNVTVIIGTSKSKIDAVNRDIKGVDFDVLVIGSDDMQPQMLGYDSQIVNEFRNIKDGYLWSYDGHQDRICTIPMMTKSYHDKFGYVYHPGYKSFFCDNEQTEVAQKLGLCTKTKTCYFNHQHPAWIKGVKYDELYKSNDTHWKHDEALYKARKA